MAGNWRRILTTLATAVLLAGCAHIMAYNDAVEAEKQGNYRQAAAKTVEAVEHAHDYPEARALWPRIWPTAANEALARIQAAEQSDDWVTAVSELESLDALQRKAQAVQLDAPLPPLGARIANARERAADKLYRIALGFETQGNLREAAVQYRRTMDYVRDYRDAAARYAKTRSAAMVRVGVLPFDNASYYHSAGDLLGDNMLQQLLSKQGEFLTFVDRQYLNTVMRESSLQASGLVDPTTAVTLGKLAGVRYLIVGRISQVSATTPTDERQQRTVTRPISDQNRQYNVSATYTLWRQVRQVVLTASVQIIDVVDGSVTKAWTETELADDTAESINGLVGDLRALDSEEQRLYYTTPNPKSHDVLLGEAAASLSKRFAARIADTLN